MKNNRKKTTTERLLFGAFIFFTMISNPSFAGDTAHVKWLITKNDGHQFKAKVQLRSNSDFKLGSTTLVFNFNNSGLANIAYNPIVLNTGDYSSSFYSWSSAGILVINYKGLAIDGFDLSPTFVDIGELSFTIIDSTQKANLSLITSNSVIRRSDNSACVPISSIDEKTPLPVTWLYIKNDKNVLSWATASEINNSHFVVLRSYGDNVYENIGVVSGNGTINSINKYSFTDYTIDKNQKSVYYKIKQVDFDGKFEFSNVISIKNLFEKDLSIFAFNKILSVKVGELPDELLVLEVYDQFGRLIKQENLSDNDFKLNLEGYPSGVYYGIIKNSKYLKSQKFRI